MEDSDCHVMPTTVAVTMAMTSTLMTTGCEKHMTLIATLIAMQAVLKYVPSSCSSECLYATILN